MLHVLKRLLQADKPIPTQGRRTHFYYIYKKKNPPTHPQKTGMGSSGRSSSVELFTYKNMLLLQEMSIQNFYTSAYGRSLLGVLAQQENMAANSVRAAPPAVR
jgi:hypothetical protein